jgi:hypothetical protein
VLLSTTATSRASDPPSFGRARPLTIDRGQALRLLINLFPIREEVVKPSGLPEKIAENFRQILPSLAAPLTIAAGSFSRILNAIPRS